jgi:hypothetical protein
LRISTLIKKFQLKKGNYIKRNFSICFKLIANIELGEHISEMAVNLSLGSDIL